MNLVDVPNVPNELKKKIVHAIKEALMGDAGDELIEIVCAIEPGKSCGYLSEDVENDEVNGPRYALILAFGDLVVDELMDFLEKKEAELGTAPSEKREDVRQADPSAESREKLHQG